MNARISWVRGLVVAVCAGALCACGNAQGNSDVLAAGPQSERTRLPGEYLVTLAAGAGTNAIADLYGRFAIKSVKPLGNNVYLVQLSEDPGPATIEALGKNNAHIKAVQPNYAYRTQGKPSIQ